MKTLKKLLPAVLLLLFCLPSQSIFAQAKNHEMGLRLTGLNSFGFIYKKERQEQKFTRYRFAFTNVGFQGIPSHNTFKLGFGFAIGTEKRKPINDKLLFIHGFEPQLSLASNFTSNGYNFVVSPALGYALGFQYDFRENFSVSIETIPALSTTFRIDEDGFNDNYSIDAGFNSNAVALSLVYRFLRDKV